MHGNIQHRKHSCTAGAKHELTDSSVRASLPTSCPHRHWGKPCSTANRPQCASTAPSAVNQPSTWRASLNKASKRPCATPSACSAGGGATCSTMNQPGSCNKWMGHRHSTDNSPLRRGPPHSSPHHIQTEQRSTPKTTLEFTTWIHVQCRSAPCLHIDAAHQAAPTA